MIALSRLSCVFLASLLVGQSLAGTVATSFQFGGAAHTYAWWDLNGDIFLRDPRTDGTGDVLVTLSPGRIQINEVHAELPSATWTGSGTFVNPVTFQNVMISLEIVTDPTQFTIVSDQSFTLASNNQGRLEWDHGFPGFTGQVSPFRFSGLYTLRGPTETVTGTFGHALTSRELRSEGMISTTNFPDELEISGGLWSTWNQSTLSLVNDTVDGINIQVGAFGIRQNMGLNFGNPSSNEFTTLSAIPEPSSALLVGLSFLTVVSRRRR